MKKDANDALWGLSPTDLTDEQLGKIYTNKLISIINLDARIESIVGDRFAQTSTKDDQLEFIRALTSFGREEWSKCQTIKVAYNELLGKTNMLESLLRNSYYYNRSSYIFWEALNENYKLVEINNYTEGKGTVADPNTIDILWLCRTSKELAYKLFDKVLLSPHMSPKSNIIANSSPELLAEFLPRILAYKDKQVRMMLLRNVHTPKEHLNALLREYAKIELYSAPKVAVAIGSDLINKLPPITRLEVLERLTRNAVSVKQVFADLKSSDEFRDFTFASAMRYPTRVSDTVTAFCRRWDAEAEEERQHEVEERLKPAEDTTPAVKIPVMTAAARELKIKMLLQKRKVVVPRPLP
jgi:hypothetical protein